MATNKTNRTTKRALRLAAAALAVLLLCGAAFAGAASAATVSTPAEWMALVTAGTAGDITLTADIDLAGQTNPMIASVTGTFDGGGYTISNFVIDGGSSDNIGLIGTYSGSLIKDLTISNFSVSGTNHVGGIVGEADLASAGSFENLKAKFGKVSGSEGVGVLVAHGWCTFSISGCSVTDCYISGSIGYVGGLVGGALASSFSGCSVADCSIFSPSHLGGLSGYSYYSANSSYFMSGCSITNCIVSAGSSVVGGLVGDSAFASASGITGCTVESCTVAATAANGVIVGGLVGVAEFATSYITDCKLTSSAVYGVHSSIALVVGSDAGTPRGLDSNVTDDGLTNYLNNETITEPVITPLDTTRTDAPAGQILITNLSGIGFKKTPYSAISYVAPKYPVSVTPSSSGTVDAAPESAAKGKTVSITASPAEGKRFVSWSVTMTSGGTSVPVVDAYNPETTFTMPAGAVTVTAEFSKEANLVGFSIDTDNLSNVWPSSDPKLYWTTEESAIKIPVGVTKISGGKYLFAYNLTFAGNMTNAADGIRTFSSNWTTIPVVDNGWNVAITANALSEDRVNITGNLSILDIGIPENTFTEGYYNLSIPYGELGVTSTTDISSPGLIELSTGDSVYFPSGDKKFVFYVRNATEDVPNTTAYEPYDAPDNYPTLASGNPGETFYYFTERLDGQEKRVYLTAVTDPAYDNLFDTNNWTISDITGVSMFNGSIADSVTADSDGKLKNSVVVNGTALGTAKITLTLNKGKGVLENITCFTFSAEPWNKSLVTNDNPVRAAGYAKDSLNWSFATPLIYNYTVSAGPVTTTGNGWNTHVKFGNETYGNATSGTAVPVVWNGTVSYNVTGTFGLKNESGKITSDTNFTVIKNTVGTSGKGDGTKRVLVTLTGFKLGDANIDGNVNIADSAIVGITVLKGDSAAEAITFLPYENRIYADCDASRSGSIDVADILAINRFIVGLDPWKAA